MSETLVVAQAIDQHEQQTRSGATVRDIQRQVQLPHVLVILALHSLQETGRAVVAPDGLRLTPAGQRALFDGQARLRDQHGIVHQFRDLLHSDLTFLIRTGWERVE